MCGVCVCVCVCVVCVCVWCVWCERTITSHMFPSHTQKPCTTIRKVKCECYSNRQANNTSLDLLPTQSINQSLIQSLLTRSVLINRRILSPAKSPFLQVPFGSESNRSYLHLSTDLKRRKKGKEVESSNCNKEVVVE